MKHAARARVDDRRRRPPVLAPGDRPMWLAVKALALRWVLGRSLGGLLGVLLMFALPLAGILKVIGIPLLIVRGIIGLPVLLVLAVIGLPLLLVVGAVSVLMAAVMALLSLGVVVL